MKANYQDVKHFKQTENVENHAFLLSVTINTIGKLATFTITIVKRWTFGHPWQRNWSA